MNEQHFKNCEYFIRHYILRDGKIYRIFCGHCTRNSRRKGDPERKACEQFVPGIPDKERFATKEYLSKELLRYVLDMELLPEIEDYPVSCDR